MIVYTTPGVLPAPWDDFMTPDQASPDVTLMTLAYLKANNFCHEAEEEGLRETGDGWVSIVLDVPAITVEIAKEWLSLVAGVPVLVEASETCLAF